MGFEAGCVQDPDVRLSMRLSPARSFWGLELVGGTLPSAQTPGTLKGQLAYPMLRDSGRLSGLGIWVIDKHQGTPCKARPGGRMGQPAQSGGWESADHALRALSVLHLFCPTHRATDPAMWLL